MGDFFSCFEKWERKTRILVPHFCLISVDNAGDFKISLEPLHALCSFGFLFVSSKIIFGFRRRKRRENDATTFPIIRQGLVKYLLKQTEFRKDNNISTSRGQQTVDWWLVFSLPREPDPCFPFKCPADWEFSVNMCVVLHGNEVFLTLVTQIFPTACSDV